MHYLLFSLFQILVCQEFAVVPWATNQHLLNFLTFRMIHFFSLSSSPCFTTSLFHCPSFVTIIENMSTVSSQFITCSSGFNLLGILLWMYIWPSPIPHDFAEMAIRGPPPPSFPSFILRYSGWCVLQTRIIIFLPWKFVSLGEMK